MRTLAIGDIHGTSAALDALLRIVRPTPEDTLIFLGDYVDRGPDTRGTLDRLIAMRSGFPHAVFLRGNHELMMTRARRSRSELRMWLSVGGAQALASYGRSPGLTGRMDDISAAHWEFLEQHCRDGFETDSHLFVHANVDPSKSLAEQPEEMLFWEFLNPAAQAPHASGKVVVCGHTSQRSGMILDLGHIVCIDTYAYGGGWLTCLDVHTRRYWQADAFGRTREGELEPR